MKSAYILIAILIITIQRSFHCYIQLDNLNYDLDFDPTGWSQQPEVTEREEIYVLEDKDYPRFLFENYSGVGQVSGISVLPSDDLVIFHRAAREWTADTFDGNHKIAKCETKSKSTTPARVEDDNKDTECRRLIKNDTIMILNREDGSAITTFGSNLFSMPHGISSDSMGNLWVTDVGRHQVMRLPTGNIIQRGNWNLLADLVLKPDIVLGEAFQPGFDQTHFCKPTEIRISSSDELIFVADGYCNRRIMVFDSRGSFLTSFGEDVFAPNSLIHSLTLLEKRNMICAADRNNGHIYCFKAGLNGDLNSLGDLITLFNYPLGEVYAIVGLGPNNLLVSSKRFDSQRYDMATLNLVSGEVKPTWISSDLIEPHSMARTNDGFFVYVADVSPNSFKKVFRFKMIKGKHII